jgi:hypothetical protein
MFKEYDVVRLREPRVAEGLAAGALGAVLIVHDATPPAYEVEFVDVHGFTIALLTLTEAELVPA